MPVNRHGLTPALQNLSNGYNWGTGVDPNQTSDGIKEHFDRERLEKKSAYEKYTNEINTQAKGVGEVASADQKGMLDLIIANRDALAKAGKEDGYNSLAYNKLLAKIKADQEAYKKASTDWSSVMANAYKVNATAPNVNQVEGAAAIEAEGKKHPTERDLNIVNRLQTDPKIFNFNGFVHDNLLALSTPVTSSYTTTDDNGTTTHKDTYRKGIADYDELTKQTRPNVSDDIARQIYNKNPLAADFFIDSHTDKAELQAKEGYTGIADAHRMDLFKSYLNSVAPHEKSSEIKFDEKNKGWQPYVLTGAGQKETLKNQSIQNLANELKVGKIDNVAAKIMLKDKDVKTVAFNKDGDIEIKMKRGKPRVIKVDKDNPFNTASTIYDLTGEAAVAPPDGSKPKAKNKYTF
jgi:hypothetical protein